MASEDNAGSLRVASFSCYLSNPEESFVQKIRGVVEPANQDSLASHRVESFSSYRKTGDDNFVFRTSGAPVQDPTIAFVFPQQVNQIQRYKSTTDGEISIFGADKYFNMELDYGASPTPHSKYSFQSGTSRWNSQNALLQNIPGNEYQTKLKKTATKRFLDSFRCQPCMDKSIGHGISQPGPKHGVQSPLVLSSGQNNQSIEEQRKSLEVVGSKRMGKGDIADNLARKLSMLTWDAIPKAQNLPTTTNGSSTVCDDMASDASLDLFEIENISGDYMSSYMSPITHYAPTEASIEWSVITASSVISDYDQKNFGITSEKTSRKAANKTKNPVGKDGQKTRPGGILGCKSHKAVSVAEPVHKTSEKAKQR